MSKNYILKLFCFPKMKNHPTLHGQKEMIFKLFFPHFTFVSYFLKNLNLESPSLETSPDFNTRQYAIF